MFQLTRSNRRKTTSARHTQVIDVPLMIWKNNGDGTKSYVKNPNKWAGKKKFIFHARPNAS